MFHAIVVVSYHSQVFFCLHACTCVELREELIAPWQREFSAWCLGRPGIECKKKHPFREVRVTSHYLFDQSPLSRKRLRQKPRRGSNTHGARVGLPCMGSKGNVKPNSLYFYTTWTSTTTSTGQWQHCSITAWNLTKRSIDGKIDTQQDRKGRKQGEATNTWHTDPWEEILNMDRYR